MVCGRERAREREEERAGGEASKFDCISIDRLFPLLPAASLTTALEASDNFTTLASERFYAPEFVFSFSWDASRGS